MTAPAIVYCPRNPQHSDYYRCVEDHFETILKVYDERFEHQYGFFRPYLQRVKCKDCNHEYLLAFSCKRRHFCLSCHQKRVVEFGEWLCMNVLKKVPHRHL